MPLTTEQRVTYAEVAPQRRLAYDSLVEFIWVGGKLYEHQRRGAARP